MPPELSTQASQDSTTTPPTTPPTTAPSNEQPAPVERTATATAKVISLPTASFARIKSEAVNRGRRLAEQESDKRAVALGYQNSADMLTQLERRAARAKSQPVEPALDLADDDAEQPSQNRQKNDLAQQAHARAVVKLEREKLQLLEDRKRLGKMRTLEIKRNRKLQRQLDANEAESQLRLAAARAGVQDVDYALHLVRRNMSGKAAAELEKFDENAYFSSELRKSHPYLYGVDVQPAHTGHSAGPAQKTLPEKAPIDMAPVDARKLSPQEYEQHLKKRGLARPMFGVVG